MLLMFFFRFIPKLQPILELKLGEKGKGACHTIASKKLLWLSWFHPVLAVRCALSKGREGSLLLQQVVWIYLLYPETIFFLQKMYQWKYPHMLSTYIYYAYAVYFLKRKARLFHSHFHFFLPVGEKNVEIAHVLHNRLFLLIKTIFLVLLLVWCNLQLTIKCT